MTLMVTAPGPHQAADRHSAPKAVALKVSASLSSVNLFPKPLMVSDSDSLRDGRYKTYAFAACFLVAAVVLIAVNASKETVFQQTAYQPTFDQYQAFEGVPSCVCSHAPRYGDAVSLRLPGFANFSTNVCGSLTGLQEIFDNRSLYTTSDSAALLYAYTTPLAEICFAEQVAFSLAAGSSLTTQVGPTLLDFPTLNHTAYQFMTTQVGNGFTAGSSRVQSTDLAASSVLPVFRADMSYGALSRTPANCSCNVLALASVTPLQAARPCTYQASFDTRNSTDARTWWGCNLDLNAVSFPISLLLQDDFYTQFGISPAEYEPLQAFDGADNVTADATFQVLFDDASLSGYYPGPPGQWDYSQLRPGLVTVDYERYYTACAPQSCIVTYSARPSAIQLITIMLVLMLSVDKGYDFFLREYCRRRARAAAAAKLQQLHASGRARDSSGDSESDGNSDDSDGDGDGCASVSNAVSGAAGGRGPVGSAPTTSRAPASATGPIARSVVVPAR